MPLAFRTRGRTTGDNPEPLGHGDPKGNFHVFSWGSKNKFLT